MRGMQKKKIWRIAKQPRLAMEDIATSEGAEWQLHNIMDYD